MDGDDIRWRPPSFLLIPFILCGSLIFIYDIFQIQTFKMTTVIFPAPLRNKRHQEEGFLIKTEGCRIPDMDAYDPSILQYIFKEDPVVCDKNNTPLVESNMTSLFVLRSSFRAYGIRNVGDLKCCYSAFHRVIPKDKENDNQGIFETCVEFDYIAHISDEFIRVVCTYNGTNIYRDFFAFVPIKSAANEKTLTKSADLPLNVLVIGLDAVSRLNLHRQMPKTLQVLQELEALEFFGYNKVGDNTFPNLIPVLTGLTEGELVNECWPNSQSRFDDCPFIWDQYSQKGYLTAFGEDSSWMGIFNYVKRGFRNQPTDYFWGPLNRISESEIGNNHDMNVYQCVGPRLVYKTLLNYIDKFTRTMNTYKRNYFGFFWGASLSHDYLNKPQLGDDSYAKFLNNLHLNGVLNDTVLIFMSDHGIRWGNIRSTYQGQLEERLPFLFIVIPKDYGENFRQAFSNLRKNTRRLSTPFDLHETLKDLLNPYALTKDALLRRTATASSVLKRGYSLFEVIPSNRTCDNASIATHWCTCQKSVDIPKSDKHVVAAALFTVTHINRKLKGYAECANLTLAEIRNARLHSFGEHLLVGKNYTQDYTIVLRTTPGDGVFEVTVRQYLSGNFTYFSVTGTISRINLYGNQSLCITEFHLKLFCYCRALLFT